MDVVGGLRMIWGAGGWFGKEGVGGEEKRREGG